MIRQHLYRYWSEIELVIILDLGSANKRHDYIGWADTDTHNDPYMNRQKLFCKPMIR